MKNSGLKIQFVILFVLAVFSFGCNKSNNNPAPAPLAPTQEQTQAKDVTDTSSCTGAPTVADVFHTWKVEMQTDSGFNMTVSMSVLNPSMIVFRNDCHNGVVSSVTVSASVSNTVVKVLGLNPTKSDWVITLVKLKYRLPTFLTRS